MRVIFTNVDSIMRGEKEGREHRERERERKERGEKEGRERELTEAGGAGE